jgi:FKBP-type peptidyl-prolyl cis-trans isomerase FkpA
MHSPFYFRACAAAVVALAFYGSAQTTADSIKLRDRLDSVNYLLGRDVGAQFKEFGTKIRMPPFTLGMNQAIAGKSSLIDSVAADTLRKEFASQASQHVQKEQQALAEKNKKTNEAFLSGNKKRSGVKSTKSGLQYMVIKQGKGPRPSATDSVLVRYKGSFIDGTVVDSSTGDQPTGFNLQRILPGLAEGISLMNVGSAYRFFLPPELAYGLPGAPPRVPPNSVLIFDITLVEIAGKK